MAQPPPPPAADVPPPPPPPAPARSLADPATTPPGAARLAVVGDVHGQWGPEDEAALAALAPTAVLFVGDFGEEDVGLVRSLAAPPAGAGASPPRFFVLGNHDAWFCLTARGRDRAARKGAAGGEVAAVSPGVRAQVEALGPAHVGWGHGLATATSPATSSSPTTVAVAGARPFSKGGARWSDVADFYAAYAGVAGREEAGDRTAAALRRAAAAAATIPPPGGGQCAGLVLLAHNGPAGLGSAPRDPCGADFLPGGGDWGDPDTAAALEAVTAEAEGGNHPVSAVPAAVLFGHMHRNLKGDPRPRDAVRFDDEERTRTVFLNAAVTPRRRILAPGVVGGGGGAAAGDVPTTACHFLVVELESGVVTAAADVWVGTHALAEGGFGTAPLLERPLLVQEEGGRRWAWQAHAGVWVAEGERGWKQSL
jgi:uncharacterized protein (TIGR04168 family)